MRTAHVLYQCKFKCERHLANIAVERPPGGVVDIGLVVSYIISMFGSHRALQVRDRINPVAAKQLLRGAVNSLFVSLEEGISQEGRFALRVRGRVDMIATYMWLVGVVLLALVSYKRSKQCVNLIARHPCLSIDLVASIHNILRNRCRRLRWEGEAAVNSIRIVRRKKVFENGGSLFKSRWQSCSNGGGGGSGSSGISSSSSIVISVATQVTVSFR